jgi:hypothetical protein
MSRVRRYSRSGLTSAHPRSPTGLSPPAVTRSSGLRLKGARTARRLPPPPAHSSNPPQASPAGYTARGVWAPPRSLAATKGILSVPRGTEMFQFPRCPLRDRSPSARPCAGRVAPFGHPRIAGCQRLPGAFRRVAASFLGRQRQGIHHAPFMWIPASFPIRGLSWPRQQTGARQRDGPVCRNSYPLPRLRSAPMGGMCVSMLLFSARGRPDTSTPAPPKPVRHRTRIARCPSRAIAVSHGRRTRRVPRGALSRCRRLCSRRSDDPAVIVRSSNLVRSRSPTSHEISQPAGGLLTAAGMLAQRRASSAQGGAAGIRTPDLRRARAALSRLSYGPPVPSAPGPPPQGGRAWTRTRDLGLIRAAL